MATNATIYKLSINIADMNRHYYHQHDLTLAQHPSETDLRLMMRIVAFALNASDRLEFTKGLSTEDEPDIWLKSLSDEIQLWIDFGQVDEKRIGKACGRSKAVTIYTYQQRKAELWWRQQHQHLARYKNLEVFHLHHEGAEALVQRKMQLQCNIQDDELYLSDDSSSVAVKVERWLS